jgi:hypothetical protein
LARAVVQSDEQGKLRFNRFSPDGRAAAEAFHRRVKAALPISQNRFVVESPARASISLSSSEEWTNRTGPSKRGSTVQNVSANFEHDPNL